MAFNIQGAIQASKSLAGAASQHVCAKFIRTYLEYGGLDTSKRPGMARQYVGYLPTIGFTKIGEVTGRPAQAEWTKNAAQPGDIAVYQKPGKPSEPGHICMWNGERWVSDFRQNNMAVYSADCQAFLYRYTGQIDNHPVDVPAGMMDGTGSSGEGAGFQELNSETLSSKCPDNIRYKGMWMRYQLQCGERSNIMKGLMSESTGSAADYVPGSTNFEMGDGTALDAALHLISHEERGLSWETPFADRVIGNLTNNELTGYQLKGEPYKTYGFGMMYTPDGKMLMQDLAAKRGGAFTEKEMRELAIDMTKRHLAKIQSYGVEGLTANQMAVLAHQFHASPGTGKYFMEKIKAEGIPTAEQYYAWKEARFKTFKNWDIYKNGWMNGARREADIWGKA